jgi:hypothetical protein
MSPVNKPTISDTKTVNFLVFINLDLKVGVIDGAEYKGFSPAN